MANAIFNPKTGKFRVFFRVGKQQFNKTLRLDNERAAERLCALIEETIQDLARGRLAIPEGADPVTFILSGGKATDKLAAAPKPTTLGDLFACYQASVVGKESSTRYTEDIHAKHLLRIIGAKTALAAIGFSLVQGYADDRLKEKHNGRAIESGTVVKELKTLRIVWKWMTSRDEGVPKDIPFAMRELQFPKEPPKPPFKTWEEIERTVRRGGLTPDEIEGLWECLYLTREEVRDVLAHAEENGARGFVHPMLAAAAFTGARRSELCRSRIDDWDLESKTLTVRQKKHDTSRTLTFRHVDVASVLATIMKGWFAHHPGGQHAFCHEDGSPLQPTSANYYLGVTLAGSRWEKIKGWHTFRHSFASNLACRGADQRIIDAWMGHNTEIRERYQHLFPKNRHESIETLIF